MTTVAKGSTKTRTRKAKAGEAKSSNSKAKTTKGKVAKPLSTKKLDKKNAKTTVKQVVKSQREIKYKYPTEVDNTLDRKAFRQKVRNEDRAFQRKLSKEKDKAALEALQTKYMTFRKKHYMVA